MSTCGIGNKKWCDHITCKYSEKSRFLDRCMSFKFEEFCDCLKAQMAADDLKGSAYTL